MCATRMCANRMCANRMCANNMCANSDYSLKQPRLSRIWRAIAVRVAYSQYTVRGYAGSKHETWAGDYVMAH